MLAEWGFRGRASGLTGCKGFDKPDVLLDALLQEGKQGTLIRCSDIGETIADNLGHLLPVSLIPFNRLNDERESGTMPSQS